MRVRKLHWNSCPLVPLSFSIFSHSVLASLYLIRSSNDFYWCGQITCCSDWYELGFLGITWSSFESTIFVESKEAGQSLRSWLNRPQLQQKFGSLSYLNMTHLFSSSSIATFFPRTSFLVTTILILTLRHFPQ